jgi:hypothetical protein
MKELYEKLGLFYLGKSVTDDSLTLLKNKNLTTHAAIIGMTGSGKTGLAIGMIEEAMIDNIPSIIIDPKGDMGNLCLRSATYDAKDFVPWVGEEKAEKTAAMWKNGIESWGQDTQRAEALKKVPVTIYTPGSSAGVSVNILSSLAVPSDEVMDDSDLFNSYLGSTVSSLLSLIGEESDIHSKIYTFLSTLIATIWQKGEDLSLEKLIASIITPSFEKVGFLPLDDFFPSNERYKLATRFNSVVANPSFSQWLEGVSLDIDALLFDNNANAKVSIFSIAHLSDSERMFFVTMLLNRYIAWMRRQSGTSALRTLLYMDEIYGYFPPSKNPPSKTPMMLLLKQARAFGIGVVLSTQNPVDLDYKGLSNIGTWFIGRLQTRQDIDKVIEGLSGKLGATQSKEEIRQLLSNLDKRVFFLKSAHRQEVERFSTRWVLSFLKGPLKRDEIKKLMAEHKGEQRTKDIEPPVLEKREKSAKLDSSQPHNTFTQFYESHGGDIYYPYLLLDAELYYHNAAKGINVTVDYTHELEIRDDEKLDLTRSYEVTTAQLRLPTQAPQEASFAKLPAELLTRNSQKNVEKSLLDYLYKNQSLQMYRVRSPRLDSKALEGLDAFKVRLKALLDDKKDQEITKLESSYKAKEERLNTQLDKAHAKLEKEESDVNSKTTDTAISAGLAILGAFFGSRSTTRFGTAISKGSRISKERRDVKKAEDAIVAIEEKYTLLQEELESKIDALHGKYALENYTIEPYQIRVKKRDISIRKIALIWRSEPPRN